MDNDNHVFKLISKYKPTRRVGKSSVLSRLGEHREIEFGGECKGYRGKPDNDTLFVIHP